jgi:hypothetical protein
LVEEKPLKIFPMYLVALAIVVIGILPLIFMPAVQKIVQLYQPGAAAFTSGQLKSILDILSSVGWYSLGFIVLVAALYYIRHLITAKREVTADSTWGCGYTGDATKMQYTASSFVRTYRKLAGPFLMIKKEKREACGLYPEHINQVTHPHDKVETWFIEKPLLSIRKLLSRFVFLQNGNIQAYILYGLIFIGLAILLPMIIDNIYGFFNLLNRL